MNFLWRDSVSSSSRCESGVIEIKLPDLFAFDVGVFDASCLLTDRLPLEIISITLPHSILYLHIKSLLATVGVVK